MSNILISDLPTITTITDEHYIPVDDGDVSSKITVENFNATATASARQYADAAATSATNAANSASDAAADKGTVQTLITSAQTLVSNAQTYANNAQSSAATATAAATTATNAATAASNSATLSNTNAANSASYATESKSWAIGGTSTRTGENTNNSWYYANEANTSATNAGISETNAATSETNAATSETNAAASATSASGSALVAEGWAKGTQNGTAVSSGTYYQDNAKYYKDEAGTSATNAATSETNAGLSATAAAGSATSASTSKEDSEAWAVGKRNGVDVPSTDPTYHNNAKYWADAASGGATGGVTSFNGRSGIVVPAASDYAANQVDYTNTTSGLTATDVQAAIDEVHGEVSTLSSGLGTAAAKDVPASGDASTTEVVMGDDSRLTDARTPVSHTHTLSDVTDSGTAAAKDSTNAVTQSSTDLVESGAVYTELTYKQPKTLDTPLTIEGTSETTCEGALGALNSALTTKQPKTLDTAITIGGTSQTTVEGALGGLNTVKADKSDLASISETSPTASQAISKGTYFYLDGVLVRALADIASGATFTLNTNYEIVTVGALNDLASHSQDVKVLKVFTGDDVITMQAFLNNVYSYIASLGIDGVDLANIGLVYINNIYRYRSGLIANGGINFDLAYCAGNGTQAQIRTMNLSSNNSVWRNTLFEANGTISMGADTTSIIASTSELKVVLT